MTQKEVIISCLSYFKVSLPLPFSFHTVFCSHSHTHGHISNLNAHHNLHVPSIAFISKPANPSLLHFHDRKLSPPCCQNSRKTPRTKSSCLRLNASCHSSTNTVTSISALTWNMLSTGKIFMHLHLMSSCKSLHST